MSANFFKMLFVNLPQNPLRMTDFVGGLTKSQASWCSWDVLSKNPGRILDV